VCVCVCMCVCVCVCACACVWHLLLTTIRGCPKSILHLLHSSSFNANNTLFNANSSSFNADDFYVVQTISHFLLQTVASSDSSNLQFIRSNVRSYVIYGLHM